MANHYICNFLKRPKKLLKYFEAGYIMKIFYLKIVCLFECKRNEVVGGQKKLHSAEHHDLNPLTM
jgi:hypothetical protein